MKTTVLLISFFFHLLLTTNGDKTTTTEELKSITIVNGTSSNSTLKQVAGKPIVIHTQIQYYDQPTLRDYQECYENLQKCKTICESVENPIECVKQCPVCPLIIKEEVVVQGVNDTDFQPARPPPINTTNIIRLTNEIHNTIESQRGSIIYNSENKLNFFQNVSTVGGKFGLGFNNTEPCCIVLGVSKSCKTKQFSTSAHCHRKRHRVCSKKCKSRIMQAKRATVCEKETSKYDENNDYSDENCYETVKYIPYHFQKIHRSRPLSKCTPIPSWPYVSCGHNYIHYRQQSICRHCQSLPYQYVLHNGIPTQCSRCFMTYASPNYEIYPMWQPDFITHNINYGIDYEDDSGNFDLEGSDWHQDRTLCKLPNGKISENCDEYDETANELSSSTSSPLNNWNEITPEAQDEYVQSINDITDDDDYEYNNNYEQQIKLRRRKRRHSFTPSKYSRRYRL